MKVTFDNMATENTITMYQLDVACDDEHTITIITSPDAKVKNVIEDVCVARRRSGLTSCSCASLSLAIKPVKKSAGTKETLMYINVEMRIGTILEDKLYNQKALSKKLSLIGFTSEPQSAAVDVSHHFRLLNSSLLQLGSYSSSLAKLLTNSENIEEYALS
jgi:hypothetical protein